MSYPWKYPDGNWSNLAQWKGSLVGTRWSLSFLAAQTIPWLYIQFMSQPAHATGVTVSPVVLLQLLLSPVCLKLGLQNVISGAASHTGEVPTSQWCQGLARSVINIPYPEAPVWGPIPAGVPLLVWHRCDTLVLYPAILFFVGQHCPLPAPSNPCSVSSVDTN